MWTQIRGAVWYRFEKFARIFSRWHKQTTFSDAGFLGILSVNLYHTLGQFSRLQICDIFFFFFPENRLTFHANCLLRRQSAWNAKVYFLWEEKKIYLTVICWTVYRACRTLTSYHTCPKIWVPILLHAEIFNKCSMSGKPVRYWLDARVYTVGFYGPVNPMGSCRAQSVYLTTHLLGRLSPLSG